MITVSMSSITSRIFIEATVTGVDSEAVVTIQDAHTNITKITAGIRWHWINNKRKKTCHRIKIML